MVVVATEPEDVPLFATGQRVHLQRFEGAHAYVVEGPRAYSSGWQYRVLLEGASDGPTWQGEHQLTRCLEGQARWRTPDEFRRDLLLAKLRLRLSDTLYTYRASCTLFEPYQFRPVLRFLASQQQRQLIADEVGLGKTIEAAMIYLELKARLGSELKRVLVVCPSRLRAKWQDELRSRFDEEFQDLGNAQAVRSLLTRWRDYGDAYRFRGIVSYELLRSESLAHEWAKLGVRLDLVIADEAHVMRNPTALTHELGQILTDNADAAVFLTATPLMLGNPDLFNLLHFLAPDDYDDFRSFPEQLRPNEYVNLAAREIGAGDPRTALDRLRWVEMTVMRERFLKDPRYQDTLARLRTLAQAETAPSTEDCVRLQRQILELNTLSAVFTRTRKREVANAKPRRAFTFHVTLSPAERAFYDSFLAQVRRDLRQANDGAASFAIVMRERMAASCLAATRMTLEESFKQRMTASLQVERSEFHLSADDDDERQAQAERLRSTGELLALSRQIGDADAKFDLFEQTLRARLDQMVTSKALVFSYFRGTLKYLLNRLTNLGYKVGVIHGGISIDERQKTIEQFRTDPSFRVLLSSEVGAEGLDFQFCDVLVNYDLPWNPMQVEQRIGRLDRFGQEADQIHIYNFVIEDSVETRIFDRLYQRIGIFERSIGDLEAILGEEIRKLSMDVIRATLTPEQEIEAAEQAAKSIIARQQAREQLEQQQDELVGQGAILDAAVEDAVAGGHVVHPEEVRSLVRTYLNAAIDPPPSFDRDEDEDCWTLLINPPLQDVLLRYTQDGQGDSGATERFKKSVANRSMIALTFDAELARRRPLLELITTRHALAVAARAYWDEQTRCVLPATRIELSGDESEAGNGHVFVYALVEEGLSRQARLHAVVILDDGRIAPGAAETILRWIATSEQPATPIAVSPVPLTEVRDAADAIVARQRDEIQREREERNAAVVAARRAAILTSFAAKERSIQSAIQATNNPAARQMNLGRLAHLKTRREDKLAELEQRGSVSVSSQLVALARVRIVPAAPVSEAEPVTPASEIDDTPQGHEGIAAWPTRKDEDDAEVAAIPLVPDDRAATPDEEEPVQVAVEAAPDRSVAQVSITDDDTGQKGTVPADAMAAVASPNDDETTESVEPAEPRPEAVESATSTPAPELPTDAPPEDPPVLSRWREIAFPDVVTVGTVFVRGAGESADWAPVGDARGTVQVPVDADVRVQVDAAAASDLDWLATLRSAGITSLAFDNAMIEHDQAQRLAELTGLRELVLASTPMADWVVRAALALPALRALHLPGSGIGDRGILDLKRLVDLRVLDLSGTPVNDLGILHLSELTALEGLSLAYTRVGNGGLIHVARLVGLRQLVLANTTASDGGMVHVAKLPALEELSLARTRITDTGLGYLTRIPMLRYLDIRGTSTTESGRRRLSPDVEVLFDQ